jgi:hypothetical protein
MEAPFIRLIERCVAPAADCAVVLATYLLTDVRGPPVKATCASPISRPQVTHDLLFERPRLDSASWFQNNVPGALLFVRAGGGRRSGLGDDPHVASALAAPSLGYAGGLLQCGVLWSGPNFHTDAALGFLMVSAGTPIAHARGMAGRGLVDAGARLSGACAVRLEWARMPVFVVCDGRMGRALRDRPP